MIPAFLLAAALAADAPSEAALVVTPFVQQGAMVFMSGRVTSGGLAGGVGAQAVWRETWLAQADLSALWTLGNAAAVRLAIGAQRPHVYAPAAWLTGTVFFGDRVELLTDDGRRPPLPTWAVGVRGSPLRFRTKTAIFSGIEPGIGTDFNGGVCLELTVVQIGARW